MVIAALQEGFEARCHPLKQSHPVLNLTEDVGNKFLPKLMNQTAFSIRMFRMFIKWASRHGNSDSISRVLLVAYVGAKQ